mgnify:CR=1 FL=1
MSLVVSNLRASAEQMNPMMIPTSPAALSRDEPINRALAATLSSCARQEAVRRVKLWPGLCEVRSRSAHC